MCAIYFVPASHYYSSPVKPPDLLRKAPVDAAVTTNTSLELLHPTPFPHTHTHRRHHRAFPLQITMRGCNNSKSSPRRKSANPVMWFSFYVASCRLVLDVRQHSPLPFHVLVTPCSSIATSRGARHTCPPPLLLSHAHAQPHLSRVAASSDRSSTDVQSLPRSPAHRPLPTVCACGSARYRLSTCAPSPLARTTPHIGIHARDTPQGQLSRSFDCPLIGRAFFSPCSSPQRGML